MKSPAKKKPVPVSSAKKAAPKSAAKKVASAKKATPKAARGRSAKPAPTPAGASSTRKAPAKKTRTKVRSAAKKSAKPVARPAAKPAAPVAKPVAKVAPPVPAPKSAARKSATASKAPARKAPSAAIRPAPAVKPQAVKPTPPSPISPILPKAAPATKLAVRKPTTATPRPKAKAPAQPVKALVELPPMAPSARTKLSLKIPALLLEGDQAPGAHPGGPGTRYALGLPAVPAASPPDEPALPAYYGTRKIWLVPRDPQWLYAHWDFDDTQQREYNQLSRDGHLILRIYDATETAEALTEIHVHPESRSWFAHVGKGGGQYVAVLGFRDRTGEWNEITRSGAVGTPPDSLSETAEAEFVILPYAVATAAPTDAGAPTLPTPPPAPFEAPADLSLEPPSTLPPMATLTEVIEVVREYIAGEPTLAEAIADVRSADQAHWPTPIELPPAAEFVHWTPEQQQALAQVISMDTVRKVWAGSHPSSVTLAQVSAAQRQKDLASAAAIPPMELGQAAPPGGGAISSPPGGLPRERSFWFNVNAELIIYGATEPNAAVIIGDRPIKLRKDGTFSYRFALPDGLYGLPISATSADRVETRYASLQFMRETEYSGEVGTHPQDTALKPPGPEHTA